MSSKPHSIFDASVNLPLLMVCCATTLVAGCGGSEWQAKTWPVSGKVSINGTSPEGAVVELRSRGEAPDKRDSRPWGVVDSTGTYTLSTYGKDDGAPIGDYTVTLRWPPTVDRPSLVDRLSGAYSDPDKSLFSVSIVEGENTIEEIRISGADIKPKGGSNRIAPPMGPPGPAMGKSK